MNEDEDDDIEIEIEGDEVDEVIPVPWHNSDTVAASFAFASNMASAIAAHFANMSLIALGQATHEWQQAVRKEFLADAAAEIDLMTKPKDGSASNGG